MSEGAYLSQDRRNPIGLGLVIAGHAAVLTAIALAPPEMVPRIIYLPTIAQSIPDTPPPPADPPPVQRAEQPQQQATVVDPIVKGGDPILAIDPLPPKPVVLPPIEPVAPDPVFLSATIDPAAMGRFQPDYPSDLVRAEIEGTATVRVLVGTDGRVKAVEQVSATHPGFFDATKRQALRYWRFKPATRDGIATESWRTMTVRFTIQR